jgi:hypothetical protein
MVGTLFDKRYRVAGRVVLGAEYAGETCYWNEFNLVTMEGESATLVFEMTERGAQWRLFTLFEPQYPLTAEDAATKQVGDPLNLEGTDVRITLVDKSRVYHIEGEAPEGVEVGDVAHYFNAEGGNTMLVVSWTGDEVECYLGGDLSYATVKSAFNLRGEALAGFSSFLNSPDAASSSTAWLRFVGVFLGVIILFVGYSSCRPGRSPAAVKKNSAPASLLTLGSAGKLNGRDYRVQAHAIVEIAQVGRLYERHEYQLFDAEGNKALLVCGVKPGTRDWVLFTPLDPLTPLTPREAAALRAGDTVNLSGYVGPVGELFQSTVRQTESAEAADSKNGTVFYGFSAQSGSTLLLVQWNDSGITFYSGKPLPPKAVASTLCRKPGG